MTTSPDEASVREPKVVILPEAGELPIAVQMRMKAKAEVIGRLHELKAQVLAITPAKAFYANNPPRKGEIGHASSIASVQDLAQEFDKAIKAVERL